MSVARPGARARVHEVSQSWSSQFSCTIRSPVSLCRFEIFVQRGFNAEELTAVSNTLSTANRVVGQARFGCRIVSDMPGLVTGQDHMLVRAEPAIDDYGFADVMVVLGGRHIPEVG